MFETDLENLQLLENNLPFQNLGMPITGIWECQLPVPINNKVVAFFMSDITQLTGLIVLSLGMAK
jgi:hypothetical protein